MDVKTWCEAIGKKQVKGREEKQSEGEDQDKDEMVHGGKESYQTPWYQKFSCLLVSPGVESVLCIYCSKASSEL